MSHVIKLLSVSTIHRDTCLQVLEVTLSIWYPKHPSWFHATFSVLSGIFMCLFTSPKEALTTLQVALISQSCRIS